jgi:DNA-binding CsgD family transcriptional regulator
VDIHKIPAPPQGSACEGLGALIETVATPQFQAEFLGLSHRLAGCGHVAAFMLGEDRSPQLVLAADRQTASLAYSASNVFVNRFWDQDPVNRANFSAHDLDRGVIVRMPMNEFQRIPYRRDCYSVAGWSSGGVNLIERVSLLRQRDHKLVRIDFFRPREAGAYRDGDVTRIAASADVLLALTARHARGMPATTVINSRPNLEKVIRRIAPDLPQREVQVCAGIAMGLSSVAIAQTLGIGINTVLTYRKRAYARLQISSHNELLRAVFAALPAVGMDEAPSSQPLCPEPVESAGSLWRN